MKPHRIQLRGPWPFEWLSTTTRPEMGAVTGRVKMPARWRDVFGDVPGRACFRRRFNKPTNLDPDETVFLILETLGFPVQVSLNGQSLGSPGNAGETLEFPVADRLQLHNELAVEVHCDAADDTGRLLWQTAAIEIRRGRAGGR